MVACTDTIRRRVGAPRTWFGRRRDHQHWAGTGRLRPCLGVGPDRPTPRTWGDVVDVFMQAGAGLAAAQAAGVVHRNVKPDNILVGEDGRVRVLGFSLARPSASLTDNRPKRCTSSASRAPRIRTVCRRRSPTC